jgi:lysophospholipase L1-like esterase
MPDEETETAAAPRPRARARRWVFAVCAALAFAVFLEGTARLVLPRSAIPVLIAPLENAANQTPAEFFRPHPTLFWELLPDVRRAPDFWGDVVNSDGLRMRGEVGEKDARVRVACFGDSCTYGLGLPVDDAWPSVLGRDPALDVINAGVPGYSSYQGALSADMRCPAWKPDVVVAQFISNDAGAWMQLDRGRVVAMTDEERAPHVRIDFLLRRSVLLGWITSLAGVKPPQPVAPDVLNAARPPRDASERDKEWFKRKALLGNSYEQLTARVPPDQLRANLVRIASHAPYAVVLLWPRRRLLDPTTQDPLSVARLDPFVEAARATASERIDVVDLAGPLLASGLTADEAFLDMVHGTRALSRIAADAVRAKIRARLNR